MANIYNTGFEAGDFSECYSSVGSVSIQNTITRNGGYAFKFDGSTAGSGEYVRIKPPGANGILADASVATSYIRFYFYYTTKPATLNEPFFIVYCTSGFTKGELDLNSSGQVVFFDFSNITHTMTTVLSASTWYRVEVKLASGSNAVYEVKLFLGDSTTVLETLSGTQGNDNNDSAVNLDLGHYSNRNSKAIVGYIDDFVWSDSAYPGPGQCVWMAPAGAGNYTSGTANGAATVWQCLNQIPSDGDTTYANLLLATQANTSTLTASGIGNGIINGVTAYCLARNLGVGGSLSFRLRSSSTDSDTTAVAATSSYAYYGKVFPTNPSGSVAWTVSALDAAQVGFAESVAGDRYTSAMLMVDYKPALVLTNSLSGSLTPSGASTKSVSHSASSSLASSGASTKGVSHPITDSLASSGVSTKSVSHSASSALTSSGASTKGVSHPASSALASSGASTKGVSHPVSSSLTSSGASTKGVSHSVSGSATPSGTFSKVAGRSLLDSLSFSGSAHSFAVSHPLLGTISPNSSWIAAISKGFIDALSLAGSVNKKPSKPFASSLSLSGSFLSLIGLLISATILLSSALFWMVFLVISSSLSPSGGGEEECRFQNAHW